MIDLTAPFADFLKELGLSQAELCKRFDIPTRTVQDWAGNRRECKPYIRKMIAEIISAEKEEKKSNNSGNAP